MWNIILTIIGIIFFIIVILGFSGFFIDREPLDSRDFERDDYNEDTHD